MEIKITIPAKKVTAKNGQVFSYPEKSKVFISDSDGHWTDADPVLVSMGMHHLTQDEVIEACKQDKNWPTIRAKHFPMYGFHE
jgi:hypothetical protein